MGGVVELLQSEVSNALEHGKKPALYLAPKGLLLSILIRTERPGTKLPVKMEAAQHIPSGQGWVESNNPSDVRDFQWFRERTTYPP